MKRKIFFFGFLLLAAVGSLGLVGPIHAASEVWVSSSGSDAASGTETDPFETIGRAIDQVEAGGSVYVKGGEYTEDISIEKTGIHLQAANTGASLAPRISGGIKISGQSVMIEGFHIVGGADLGGGTAGIYITANTLDTIIQDNVIEGVGTSTTRGILLGYHCDNIQIYGNEISDWTSGVYINPSSHIMIENNTIRDCVAGIGSDGLSHALISGNYFFDNDEGFGASSVGEGVRVHFNSFDGSNNVGVQSYGENENAIDARYNWWGSESGPNSSSVVGNVNAANFLADANIEQYQNSCVLTVTGIPAEGAVHIRYGETGMKNGDSVVLPLGTTIQWKLELSGYQSGYWTHTAGWEPLRVEEGDHYCPLEISGIPEGGQIYFRYSSLGWLGNGSVLVPKVIDIQWKMKLGGYDSPYWTHSTENCKLTIQENEHYCNMSIAGIPSGGQVYLRYSNLGWIGNGSVMVPQGINIQWKLKIAGYDGPYWTHSTGNCEGIALTAESHYSQMEIKGIPEGGQVYLRYSNLGWLGNGTVVVPKGITIQWKLKISGYDSEYWDHETQSSDVLSVTEGTHYCTMEISGVPDGGKVYLRYSNLGWLENTTVLLPKGISVQWKLKVSGYDSGYKTKSVDCTGLELGLGTDYCEMAIDMPAELARAGGEVYLRYSSVGWLSDGDIVTVPMGINIQWKLKANGIDSIYQTKQVDCTPLLVKGSVTISLPTGVSVELYRNGWYQNGDSIDIVPTKNYKYRNANDNKKVITRWKYKSFSPADWGGSWDLTGEFCDMKVDIGESDGWVEIYRVGWYQTNAQLWMPVGANFKYRAANKNKKVITDWMRHTVDEGCSDLAPDFCNMKVDLGGSDGWVEIYRVGWYQTNAQVWMPVGANFKYRAANANKKVITDWMRHAVDKGCSDLAPDFCHLPINLGGSDGWVEIYRVGWYQDDQVWMPVGANFKYRAANANKKVITDWMRHTVDEACSNLAPHFCHIQFQLRRNVWDNVEIYRVGHFQDKEWVWLPTGSNFKYRAFDANGEATDWRRKEVADCAPFVPMCTVQVQLPEGVFLKMEHIGWFQNGDSIPVEPVRGHRYDLYDSEKQVHTGWKTHQFSAGNCGKAWDLNAAYYQMTVDLDGGNGIVHIEHVGDFVHGDTLWMPKGASFRYKAFDNGRRVQTHWKTMTADGSPLKPGYCHMAVDLGGADGIVHIEHVGDFKDTKKDTDKVWMPVGATFRYKAFDAKRKVDTNWQTFEVADADTVLSHQYCHLAVDWGGADGVVHIEHVGDLEGAKAVWMPVGATFRYKAFDAEREVDTNWRDFEVADVGSVLTPGYCDMEVDLGGANGRVHIEHVRDFVHGEKVWMPVGATFRYKAFDATRKVDTNWQTFEVAAADTVLAPQYCHLAMDLDGADGIVHIEHVGDFKDTKAVWMPVGATFRYKAFDAKRKVDTNWQTFEVADAATVLAHQYCHLAVDWGGADGVVHIEHVGDLEGAEAVWMPVGATFRYKVFDAEREVDTNWKTFTVEANCAPLSPAYHLMGIDVSTPYTQVVIEHVGWFDNGEDVYMPISADLRFKACDADKGNCTGWQFKKVDDTDLVYPSP